MLRRLPTRPFQSFASQPTLLVTATSGLLHSARLYRLSDAHAERAIIETLGDLLDYVPRDEPARDWTELRELADDTHGGGFITDYRVSFASLPYPDFRSASELELYAFILIRAANVAEAVLFETEEEAEAHGLKVCREYFNNASAAECFTFEQIVELDADNDCSAYVIKLRANGAPGGRPDEPAARPGAPSTATEPELELCGAR